jgi:alanyl-tRNA synthetase
LNLSILNRTAAEVAAAAFLEKFPGVELLGGRRSSLGFSFDFRIAAPLPPEIEILIEEAMRQIVREKRPIRVLEMVPFSARELLLKEGHAARAEEAGGEGLVEVVQIGSYHNLSPGPHLSSTSGLAAFKLWPMKKIEVGVYRLSGCAFPTKEELKQFLKDWRDYPEKSHERAGLKKSLWRLLGAQVVWLPGGQALRKGVVETVRANLFHGALEVNMDAPAGADRTNLYKSIGKETGAEAIGEIYGEPSASWDPETGLFAGAGGTRICLALGVLPGDWEKKITSSLQLTGKTLNLLGFQHRLSLSRAQRSGKNYQALAMALKSLGEEVEMLEEEPGGLRLDYLVRDFLGREWPAFSIELGASHLLITASVERLVALLLEMNSHETKR